MSTIFEDIRIQSIELLKFEFSQEMFKLKICSNLGLIHSILEQAPADISSEIAEELELNETETEFLSSLRLVDLNIHKIESRLKDILFQLKGDQDVTI